MAVGCARWKWIGADTNPSPEGVPSGPRGVATPAFAAGPRQPLAYARGSDSRIPYARILSIGLHLGTSSTSKSRTRYFFCSCGPGEEIDDDRFFILAEASIADNLR
jgi:hypothetical protein